MTAILFTSRRILISNHNFPRLCLRKMSTSVYVTRKLPKTCISLIENAGLHISIWDSDEPVPHDILKENIKGKSGILCMLSDVLNSETILSAGPQLKVISTMSVGFDHIDTSSLKKSGIRLGYTPDVLTDATAELAMALLLATTRRLSSAITAAKDGSWGSWKPFWMCGHGLTGATVGVVGMGRIGRAIAERCVPFGVKRVIFSRSPGRPISSTPERLSGGMEAEQVVFEDLLREADFVVVSCAFNKDTKNLFDTKAFTSMKPSSVFINISRGAVVDQSALYEALTTNQIWAAGLDVTTPEPLPLNSPLLKLDNCTILPHIGSANFDTREAMSLLAVNNLIEGLKGPQVTMPAEVKL